MSSVGKRTVSMCWYSEQDRRACTVPNLFCKNHPDSGCTEYVLVIPHELAALEAEAAKVASLETQVATLTEAMGKKDEALRQFLIGAKHESCMYAPEDPDPTWHCCNWSEVVEQVEAALSLTPASVAQQAEEARVPSIESMAGILPADYKTTEQEAEEYERIGRDVEEWYRSQGKISIVLNPALEQLGEVIAKARQQDKTE